ncbi:MAG: type II secretion system protein L [Pseudomonadales bacterium]|jgi:type II secretion system protein L
MAENQSYIADFASLNDEQKAVCQIVIVPSTEISFFRVEMPKVARGKWAQLTPWLLEDKLLTAAEDVHIAFGERDANGLVPVAVVAKEQMQCWVESIEAGQVENCIADVFELPYVEDKWVVSYDAGYARVRSGEYEGFAGSTGWVESVVAAQSEIAIEVFDSSAMSSKAIVLANSINLLQGAYKAKKNNSSSESKAWLPMTVGIAVVLLLFITNMLVEAYQFNQTADSYRQSSERDFKRLFGSALDANGDSLRQEAEYLQRYTEHKGQQQSVGASGLLQAVDRVVSKCQRCNLVAMNLEGGKLALTFNAVEAEFEAKLTKITSLNVSSNKVGENTVVSIMRDAG